MTRLVLPPKRLPISVVRVAVRLVTTCERGPNRIRHFVTVENACLCIYGRLLYGSSHGSKDRKVL
jgi:hypothetical protein